MADPTISVLIRTFNSERTLPQVLARLRATAQDQVLVVDSGSNDDTLAIATKAGAQIVNIQPGEFTFGRAINLGFTHATGEWVLVLSSHCVPLELNLLQTYRKAIPRFGASVAAAVGPLVNSELDWEMRTGITFFNRADFEGGFGFAAGNPNALYRRELWRGHSFYEGREGGEDYEWFVWALLNGFQVAAVHAAAVRYISQRPLSSMLQKGRWDYRTLSHQIKLTPPALSTVAAHALKQAFYTLVGRLPPRVGPRTVTHLLGMFLEGRAMREKQPVPRILDDHPPAN